MNRIQFKLVPFRDDATVRCVEPIVDGTPLTRLVKGDHVGLIWAYFDFGTPSNHFRGIDTWNGNTEIIALLGCSCGEWGCDPFEGRLAMTDVIVQWSHRSIGTLEFDRRQYEAELADLDEALTG